MTANDIQRVAVKTSARLHMGFYDLHVLDGFGSVGVAIDEPDTRLTLICQSIDNDYVYIRNPEAERVLEHICSLLNIDKPPKLIVQQSIPRHAGLGSGTQLALALGAGLNVLYGLGFDMHEIARLLGRGKRSGIGVASFVQGGFVIDGGRVSRHAVPSVERRLHFPDDWRVILVQDSANAGLSGAVEIQAFEKLAPARHDLRDVVFSHMIPALERLDLLAFGAYMKDLQAYNGNYFAPIQGGQYASQVVEGVMQWFESNGVACVGQSSWGPTGFAIVESEATAQMIVAQARSVFEDEYNIDFKICRGRNHGAIIEVVK